MAVGLSAQTFTTLYSFDAADGEFPGAALVQGTDGNLYGTTANGGPNLGIGTVFKITPRGELTTLYTFCPNFPPNCPDGSTPAGSLVQAPNGDFYGTTLFGGAYGGGTIYKITANGALTTLYSFCQQGVCPNGYGPPVHLTVSLDGDLYGTTIGGGISSNCTVNNATGCGTIFRITPRGRFTTLFSFCVQSGCPDGSEPTSLIQAADGEFYGIAAAGGAYGSGTIFKMSPGGSPETVYTFCAQSGCTDGALPIGLVQAADGNLFGTTVFGGVIGRGTVFRLTPAGALTTLHSFRCSSALCPEGRFPNGGLIQGTDGNFYGTTPDGGISGAAGGTIFKITPSGELTTLYNFCPVACILGGYPQAGLTQGTDGTFYGTASEDGTYKFGSVFSLSAGLGPFVKAQPASGMMSKAIQILGTKLIGATSVTFNGAAATFNVVSSSLITTSVPAGATTGTIQVVTPGGTLSSNVPFHVLP